MSEGRFAERAGEAEEFDFLSRPRRGRGGGAGPVEGDGFGAAAGAGPGAAAEVEVGGTAPYVGPASGQRARIRRRRSDAGTGRRSRRADYAQISARVERGVKAGFDLARARENVEEGRERDQAEVIETLMRFYAEHGDPYALLD